MVTEDVLQQHGINESEYNHIVGIPKREPTLPELRHFQRYVERALQL